MAIRKLIVCLSIAGMAWVNIFAIGRAYFPYDPKIHDVVDRGGKVVSVERVQQIADDVSDWFRCYVIPILMLDILVVVLSYFALTRPRSKSINAEMAQQPGDNQ